MSKKIVGITVGTPLSVSHIKEKIRPVTSVNGVEADVNGDVVVRVEDGVSPTVQVTQQLNGAKVTITDKNGEQWFVISDGYSVYAHVGEIDGGHRVTLNDAEDEKSFDVMDGRTPVKGEDYWTAADKQEMVNDVLNALPTWEGGSF